MANDYGHLHAVLAHQRPVLLGQHFDRFIAYLSGFADDLFGGGVAPGKAPETDRLVNRPHAFLLDFGPGCYERAATIFSCIEGISGKIQPRLPMISRASEGGIARIISTA